MENQNFEEYQETFVPFADKFATVGEFEEQKIDFHHLLEEEQIKT